MLNCFNCVPFFAMILSILFTIDITNVKRMILEFLVIIEFLVMILVIILVILIIVEILVMILNFP